MTPCVIDWPVSSIKKYGNWWKKYEKQKGCCAICGKPFTRWGLTKDHIIPKSKGGSNKWDNIQLACAPCNVKKGDKIL